MCSLFRVRNNDQVFHEDLLMKTNHLSRAPVSGVRTGYRPGGVLKRDCISCEPDSQPPLLPAGFSARLMTIAQPPSSANFATSGLLSFAAGCFFDHEKQTRLFA